VTSWRRSGPRGVASQTSTKHSERRQLYSQKFRDAEAEEIFGPTLRAAFAGEYEVPPQRTVAEPLIAYALFIDNSPESIAKVVDTADYIWRLVPTADELAWAFVQLKSRGWLLVQGNLYGLTAEGKSAIASVVGEDGDQFKKVKRLEAWTSVHPNLAKGKVPARGGGDEGQCALGASPVGAGLGGSSLRMPLLPL